MRLDGFALGSRCVETHPTGWWGNWVVASRDAVLLVFGCASLGSESQATVVRRDAPYGLVGELGGCVKRRGVVGLRLRKSRLGEPSYGGAVKTHPTGWWRSWVGRLIGDGRGNGCHSVSRKWPATGGGGTICSCVRNELSYHFMTDMGPDEGRYQAPMRPGIFARRQEVLPSSQPWTCCCPS